MKPTDVVLAVAGAIALFGILSAGFVLTRELRRRFLARRAVERVERARALVGEAEEARLEEVARGMRGFDNVTVERTVEALLADGDARRSAWAGRLFDRLGMLDRYVERLRSAPSWSERTHVAHMLGKVGLPDAVPALVSALRDAYEDVSVKAASAEALAAIKDPGVVALLVDELAAVDEHATPRISEALVGFGELATPGLLKLLEQHENPPARVWAARILGRIKDPRAVDVLAARLRDRHDLLRVAVAEALGAIGDSRALQPLVQATLRDPASQVRAHAAGAVALIAGPRSADVLVAALADPDYATRLRALEAFENIRLEDTSALEQALGDTNVEVRRRAALALERVGYLDRVLGQLADPDRKNAKRAYAVLLELGSAGLADGIAAHIHHESMPVRASVARACGDLGVRRVGPILVAALDDREWPVRAALCEAIGKLRAEGGAEAMARHLADPEENVREAAAEALSAFTADELESHWVDVIAAYQGGTIPVRLAMIGIAARVDNPEMTRILVQGASDPSETVRLRAVRSFAGRPDEVAVPPLIACLTDSSLDVRMSAATALGSTTSADAFEALLRALPGAPTEVRERIAQALAKVSPEQLMGRVEELARSDDVDVRLGIAWTLGKRGDGAGIALLSSFLRDREPRLRASAAGALGKIPSPITVEALLLAVEDRDPKTRAAVVNALSKTAAGNESASLALSQRLRDPDLFVRNRAAIALARVAGSAAEGALSSPEVAGLIDDPAFVIAQGLIATEEALNRALTALLDAPRRARLEAFLAREEPPVRSAFFRNLKLDDPGTSEVTGALEPAALAVRYEQLLRGSQDVKERITAIEALARLRTDRSAAILADALMADPSEPIRLRSAEALAAIGDDDVGRTALIRAIADPSGEVATSAIRALAGVRDQRISAALFRRLGSGPSSINDVVEEALADHHKDDVVALLDRIMGVERGQTLVSSLRVLQRVASPEALPLLVELLKSEDAGVRAGTVRAIGRIPLAEASQVAGRMLDDPHELVRIAALEAIASEDAGSALVRMAPARADPSVRVRARLAELLAVFQGASLRVLDALLEDAAPVVRAEALGTLLAIADAESMKRFATMWSRASVEARHELRSISRAAAITQKLAATLTTSPDPVLRETAITAIPCLGVAGYERYLEPALFDPKASVRLAAVLALSAAGAIEIRRQLGPLLHDPDSAVREAARQAMERAG